MASNPSNNALFGDDSDSSDDDVGKPAVTGNDGGNAEASDAPAGDAATPRRTKIGSDDSSDDDDDDAAKADTAKRQTEEKTTTSSDGANAGDDKNDNDENEDNEDKESKKAASNKNSSLFGDDDSSDDDEFDGNDGIVGRTDEISNNAGGRKVLTMNQTLGLESDSDDDPANAAAAGGTKGEEKGQVQKPRYVPPRRMELLKLSNAEEAEEKKEEERPFFHFAKLPNLVGINSKPFNTQTHDHEEEEEYYRGYVHNMIRWRYKYNSNDGGEDGEHELLRDANGDPVRESNTRLVKWSDGSYTLHVGQEVLEVDNLDSSINAAGEGGGPNALAGFAGINGYLYASQKARIRPPSKKELEKAKNNGEEPDDKENKDNDDDDDDDDDDTPAQPAGTVLECLGPISSRFAPRPASLHSEAHRNLTLAMRQRNVKRARIAEFVTEVDPEKEKMARIKGKDDLAKSQARSSARDGGGRRGGGGRRNYSRGMNARYLEEDGDYDGVNLKQLKRQTMRRDMYSDEEDDVGMDYGDDSEDEDDEWSKNKRKKPAKRDGRGASGGKGSGGDGGGKKKRPEWDDDEEDEEEEGELVFGDDDDDDDGGMFKKRGGGASKKAFLDDDDD